MNPLPTLIALWRAIVQVVVDVFHSEEPLEPSPKADPAASRERRQRNARRREMRARHTRRCRHGRQVRTSPRSRLRRRPQPGCFAPVLAGTNLEELVRPQGAVDPGPTPDVPSEGFALADCLDAPSVPVIEASIEVIEVRRNKSEDGWEAVLRGHRRAPLCASKEDAIAAARKRLSEGTGGEILVLNETGKVIETIPVLGAAGREVCPHLDGARVLSAA